MSNDFDILNGFGRPPFPFNPNFLPITGNAKPALMLSYAVTKGAGWWPMSGEEWQIETGLTRTELETARKVLVSMGLLEHERRGLPCRTFYRVNIKRVVDELRADTLKGVHNG